MDKSMFSLACYIKKFYCLWRSPDHVMVGVVDDDVVGANFVCSDLVFFGMFPFKEKKFSLPEPDPRFQSQF